jgi:hypothetical protein
VPTVASLAQRSRNAKAIGDLIQLHRDDLQEVGNRIGLLRIKDNRTPEISSAALTS